MVKLVHRQMLHAAELHFRHPVTDQEMSFAAPAPGDFAAALALLRAGSGEGRGQG